jgi:hypothetical protein
MLIPFGILSAAGAGVGVAGDYELIETSILTSSASSVTFSNLGTYSSTYKHLQVRAAVRGTSAAVLIGLRARLGTASIDTSANYSRHQLFGSNGSVSTAAAPNATEMFAGAVTAANATENSFGAVVIDLLDVFSSTKNKTIRTLGGHASGTGTNAIIVLESGNWRNLNPVQLVELLPSGGNFGIGSRFSLYGVKG